MELTDYTEGNVIVMDCTSLDLCTEHHKIQDFRLDVTGDMGLVTEHSKNMKEI